MHTPRKRTALLASVAIGAVATMGLGYALWTETLNIGANVNTGSLNVAFANLNPVDNEPAGGQDDAQCAAVLGPNDDSFTVTLTDAYPGYRCDIATGINNSGTVDAIATAFSPDASTAGGMITITRAGGATAYPDGATTPGPTYTVAVNPSATTAEVGFGSVHTVGASIDFANATP